MSEDLRKENEELKRLLWETFVPFQMDILSVAPADRAQFLDFIDGKTDTPPFVVGSESYRICELCGKVK